MAYLRMRSLSPFEPDGAGSWVDNDGPNERCEISLDLRVAWVRKKCDNIISASVAVRVSQQNQRTEHAVSSSTTQQCGNSAHYDMDFYVIATNASCIVVGCRRTFTGGNSTPNTFASTPQNNCDFCTVLTAFNMLAFLFVFGSLSIYENVFGCARMTK